VNVLNALSATLGQGVGTVSLNMFFFFESVYIPAYSSVNKPGRSYEPLHLEVMCLRGAPRSLNMLPYHNYPNYNFQIFPPTQIVFAGINILLVVSSLSQCRCIGHDNTISLRQRETRLRAAMPSQSSSTESKTSLYVSRPIQNSRRLRRWRT
jgi:hypothetical protein